MVQSLGYRCPPRVNPADFFLDIISNDHANVLPAKWAEAQARAAAEEEAAALATSPRHRTTAPAPRDGGADSDRKLPCLDATVEVDVEVDEGMGDGGAVDDAGHDERRGRSGDDAKAGSSTSSAAAAAAPQATERTHLLGGTAAGSATDHQINGAAKEGGVFGSARPAAASRASTAGPVAVPVPSLAQVWQALDAGSKWAAVLAYVASFFTLPVGLVVVDFVISFKTLSVVRRARNVVPSHNGRSVNSREFTDGSVLLTNTPAHHRLRSPRSSTSKPLSYVSASEITPSLRPASDRYQKPVLREVCVMAWVCYGDAVLGVV